MEILKIPKPNTVKNSLNVYRAQKYERICARLNLHALPLPLPLVPPERMLTKALAVDTGTLFCEVCEILLSTRITLAGDQTLKVQTS